MPLLARVRTKLSDIAASMDAFSTRIAHVEARTIFWALVYAVTLGTGVFVRYLRAQVDLPAAADLKVGGFQGGVGLRVRF